VIRIAVTKTDKPCSTVSMELLHVLHSIQVSHTQIYEHNTISWVVSCKCGKTIFQNKNTE